MTDKYIFIIGTIISCIFIIGAYIFGRISFDKIDEPEDIIKQSPKSKNAKS